MTQCFIPAKGLLRDLSASYGKLVEHDAQSPAQKSNDVSLSHVFYF